ncbi:hypothetical protein OAP74_00470 [bacterium]|nr:hypothetical protein [bacterium]
MTITEYQPTNCKNCGHYSHCGQPLWKENNNPQDGNNMYKACDACRCEKCKSE